MNQNRILDDLSRLFSDAAGAAGGVRREIDAVMRAQLERIVKDMDVVSREEYEATREIAVAAREEAQRLALRIDELEARLVKLTSRPD
ncbi:accessory factor UbiK family protein [Salinarimonas rosea]|uniref:accessory factor UbiK family protein n=1 Tax=Salinarimonas rosea TaxID=552063 RepID=UPI000428603F|nr:accessory factor UbiK family protein [Salinarimonas rosea]